MLSVITHTKRSNIPELERTIRSVQAALPDGAEHRIIDAPTYEIWRDRRWRDLLECEYVAIVDDDDEVHPDALRLCFDAMKANDVGIVFTDEKLVNRSKQMRSSTVGPRRYNDVMVNPLAVHHLCVIRTACIDHRMDIALAQTQNVGADWMIKASAALTGGALHIPVPGYYWYQQPIEEKDRRRTDRQLYANQITRERMLRVIRQRWGKRDGLIPQLTTPPLREYTPEMMR